MEVVVKVAGLKKSYGKHEVLKGIDFQVHKGETCALLGVNGAGKTTTLECVQGLRTYQEGEIQIVGTCGVQLQSATLPPLITVKEAVTMFSKWHTSKINEDLWVRLGVEEIKNQRYQTLSTGQKRRVHLLLALLHDPDILFLDEPTAGLDVEARHELHAQIQYFQQLGKTIILASHDMQEVEQFCDHIIILKDGLIAFDGNQAQLSKLQATAQVLIKMDEITALPQFSNATFCRYDNGNYVFEAVDVASALYEILNYAHEHSVAVQDVQIIRATLESSFLNIAKEEL